jgi:glc operon protein GlcG
MPASQEGCLVMNTVSSQLRAVAVASLCALSLTCANSARAGDDNPGADAALPTQSYSVSLSQSLKLIDKASAIARARHLAMSFVVVDPAGHLVAAVRMDGAPFVTVDFARGKAFASVALGGQSGLTLEQRYRDDPSEYSNVSGAGYHAPFLPARGVFPIFAGGHLLGAMGAGGAPSQIDDEVIKVAIESIGASTQRAEQKDGQAQPMAKQGN